MSDSLTIASLHYQGGRYGLAAEFFDRASEELPAVAGPPESLSAGGRKRKRPDGETCGDPAGGVDGVARSKREGRAPAEDASRFFGALPSLAASADAALCRARSALARGGPTPSRRSLVEDAIDKNGVYVRALISASMRLRRAEALEGASASSLEGSVEGDRHGSCVGAVVGKYRTQLACAALASGVSESWLYMALSDAEGAGDCLLDAAKVAVSCFWDYCAEEKTALLKDGAEPVVLPPELLRISSIEAIQTLDACIDCNDERARYALKSFHNAIRVVGLASDRISCLVDVRNEGGSTNSASDVMLTKTGCSSERSKAEGRVEDSNKRKSDSTCFVSEDKRLRVQELVTHALTQHKRLRESSTAHDKAALRRKRDSSLSDAVAARPDGPSGLARRLQILLNGMDLASHSTIQRSDISKVINGLQFLAPSSGTACSLLGCIFYSEGEVEKALDRFQEKLDMDDKQGLDGSLDHKETVSNMAYCFSLLGEAKPAQELLLHALASPLSKSSTQSSVEKDCVPLRLLITADGCQMSNNNGREMSITKLLWRLFHASSRTGDWALCLASAEELCGRNSGDEVPTADGTAAHCAHVFALLQSHRPSIALKQCTVLATRQRRLTERSAPLSLVLDLYEADATISTESGFGTDDPADKACSENSESNSVGVVKVCELTNRSEMQLDSFTSTVRNEDSSSRTNSLELEALTKNNRGIALLMANDNKKAMQYFKDAALAAVECSNESSQELVTGEGTADLVCLQPHFNLALMLWREGHRCDAAKVWLMVRGLGDRGSKSPSSYASQLRTALEEAISRHGLFCAKQQTHGHGTGGEHIPAWCAGRSASNLFKEQIFALDILVLQHALAQARKREHGKGREGLFR